MQFPEGIKSLDQIEAAHASIEKSDSGNGGLAGKVKVVVANYFLNAAFLIYRSIFLF